MYVRKRVFVDKSEFFFVLFGLLKGVSYNTLDHNTYWPFVIACILDNWCTVFVSTLLECLTKEGNAQYCF